MLFYWQSWPRKSKLLIDSQTLVELEPSPLLRQVTVRPEEPLRDKEVP